LVSPFSFIGANGGIRYEAIRKILRGKLGAELKVVGGKFEV